MARIAGVTIPDNKKVKISLTYVHGIGRTTAANILDTVNIDPETRVKDLTETELNQIREIISSNHTVEGELQRIVSTNIKRLRDINAYRGLRHKGNLPSRGQRTRTNARTRRGRRQTVGGLSIKAASKT
jgi:small subunit ribosomal protein S13